MADTVENEAESNMKNFLELNYETNPGNWLV